MRFAIRPFSAGDVDWLVDQHAGHYRRAEGFDSTFGVLVATILAGFLENRDDVAQEGWIAHDGDIRLGSIFCMPIDDRTAKLRLFYVIEAGRGTDIAQALLDTCLQFAKGRGYAGLTLWTHESHVAAGRIYARNGFTRTCTKPVRSFGVDLVEETWQITF